MPLATTSFDDTIGTAQILDPVLVLHTRQSEHLTLAMQLKRIQLARFVSAQIPS
jgi:hypothetical protein